MGSDCLVKPRRSKVFGVPPSIIHRVVVPSGFFTSMWIHEWGLINSSFATVPRSFNGFLASNSAVNAWCAYRFAEVSLIFPSRILQIYPDGRADALSL